MKKRITKILLQTGITCSVAIGSLVATASMVSVSNTKTETKQSKTSIPTKLSGKFRLNQYNAIQLKYNGLENPKYFNNFDMGGTNYKIATDGQRIFTTICSEDGKKGGLAAINEQDGSVAWFQEIPNYKNITGIAYDKYFNTVMIGHWDNDSQVFTFEIEGASVFKAETGEVVLSNNSIQCYNGDGNDWNTKPDFYGTTATYIDWTHGNSKPVLPGDVGPIISAQPRIFANGMPDNSRATFGFAYESGYNGIEQGLQGYPGFFGEANNADKSELGRGVLRDGFEGLRLKSLDLFGKGFDASFNVNQSGQLSYFENKEGPIIEDSNGYVFPNMSIDQSIASNREQMTKLLRTMPSELYVDFREDNGSPKYHVGQFINLGGDQGWKFVSLTSKYGYPDPLDMSDPNVQIPMSQSVSDYQVADLSASGININIQNVIYTRNTPEDRIDAAYIYASNANFNGQEIGPCILKYDMYNWTDSSKPFGTTESFQLKTTNPNSRLSVYTTLKDIVPNDANISLVGFKDGIIGAIQNDTGNYYAIAPLNDIDKSQLAYDSTSQQLASEIIKTNSNNIDAFALEKEQAQQIINNSTLTNVNQLYVEVSELLPVTDECYNGKRDVNLRYRQWNNGVQSESNVQKVTLSGFHIWTTSRTSENQIKATEQVANKIVTKVTEDDLKTLINDNINKLFNDAPKNIDSSSINISSTTLNPNNGTINVTFNLNKTVSNGVLKNESSGPYSIEINGFQSGLGQMPPGPDANSNQVITQDQIDYIKDKINYTPSISDANAQNELKQEIANTIFQNMKNKIDQNPGKYPENVVNSVNEENKDKIVQEIINNGITVNPTSGKPIKNVTVNNGLINGYFGIDDNTDQNPPNPEENGEDNNNHGNGNNPGGSDNQDNGSNQEGSQDSQGSGNGSENNQNQSNNPNNSTNASDKSFDIAKIYTYWWFWVAVGVLILLIILLIILLAVKKHKNKKNLEQEERKQAIIVQPKIQPVIVTKTVPTKKVIQVKQPKPEEPIKDPNAGRYNYVFPEAIKANEQPKKVVLQRPVVPSKPKDPNPTRDLYLHDGDKKILIHKETLSFCPKVTKKE